ncbi:hypothetical protein GFL39_29420 [Rhizobium leguminosarum bv. viciae]|nr:hypothetical protein [Rhizobium leguminosarum bv. viciae]NKL94650.1 hypothetical protein [Rhizobium leguminosarum bv. viciae]
MIDAWPWLTAPSSPILLSGMRSRRTGKVLAWHSLPAPRNRKNRCVHHLRHVRLTRRDLGGLTDSRSNGSARSGLFASVIATRFEKHSENYLALVKLASARNPVAA